MQTLSDKSIERILAIRLDNIGDLVMLGPSLRSLKRAFPGAAITLMASPSGSQVSPLLPWVDDVITWRAVWQDIAEDVPVVPEREYELVERLEAGRFDAAFIFTSFSQSPYPPAYACYLASIPVRVGQSKEFGGGLLSHWVKPMSDDTHQVDRNLYLLRAVGIRVDGDHLELNVQAGDAQRAAALLADAGVEEDSPFIALSPGASAASRRYDEKRYAQVARILVERTNVPAILLGSAKEAGKFPTLEALAAQHAGIHSLIGRTTVAEMAGVIQRASLLVANNSGAMHIASAFNRPMVILFAGTEKLGQWTPRSEGVRILNRPTECSPCYTFQCPYHMECLDIPAEEVATTALQLIKTVTKDRRPSQSIAAFSGR